MLNIFEENAIEYTQKNQSVTYLVFLNAGGERIGYFGIGEEPE